MIHLMSACHFLLSPNKYNQYEVHTLLLTTVKVNNTQISHENNKSFTGKINQLHK